MPAHAPPLGSQIHACPKGRNISVWVCDCAPAAPLQDGCRCLRATGAWQRVGLHRRHLPVCVSRPPANLAVPLSPADLRSADTYGGP
jgi:hypothetical protein